MANGLLPPRSRLPILSRPVQRKIATLSLIVYLLGGWLLPALHRHGHGGCKASHAESVCSEESHGHAASTTQSRHSHGACECEATADCPPKSVEAGAKDAQFAWISDGGQTTSHEHGLCSICVAKNTASIVSLDQSLAFQGDLHEIRSIVTDLMLFKERYDIALSRGPPASA
jgi:hypothetical protein